MTARATSEAALCSFPIEGPKMQLPQLFATVNTKRAFPANGSTRLNSTEASPNFLPSCHTQGTFVVVQSIFLLHIPICDHACLQKVYSPLAPASCYQWRPLQLYHRASCQTAYLCTHSESRRDCTVRFLTENHNFETNAILDESEEQPRNTASKLRPSSPTQMLDRNMR